MTLYNFRSSKNFEKICIYDTELPDDNKYATICSFGLDKVLTTNSS